MSQERNKYLTIFEMIPNPAIILDIENRIDNLNNIAFELFQELLPTGIRYYGKVAIGDVLPWLCEDLEAFVAGDAAETTVEKIVETGKSPIHFQVRMKRMLNLYEKPVGTILILNDITDLKSAERRVSRARDFYLTLFEEFPTMIWRAGADGKFNYVNRAWVGFTGRRMEDELGDGWIHSVIAEDLDRFQKIFQEAFSARKPFETEFRIRRHDGRSRWVLNVGRPFTDLDGNFAGYIGSCYDIQDRKAHEQEMYYQATHDALTGLPNRRVFEVALQRVVAKTGRGEISAVLVMDLDRFKEINDRFGHNAGDRVLIDIGVLLRTHLRESDLLIRLGGDEYALLLEDTSEEEGRAIARRLCESVAGYEFGPDRGDFRLSLSVGLAFIRERELPDMILSRADKAMYKAKEMGGNRCVPAD